MLEKQYEQGISHDIGEKHKLKKAAIGIDFGGTFIKMAMVNEEGKILYKKSFSTLPERDKLLEKIIQGIDKTVKNKSRDIELKGVGIGLPGPIDSINGIVRNLTNVPGWRNFPLEKFVRQKIKMPVFIDNDANLMTYGEWRFGAGRGAKNIICITLGTGVGGGIIIEGKIYRGSSLSAGEVGHIPIFENGLKCACGGRGCLERYIGNRYIIETARKYIKKQKTIIPQDKDITPQIISNAAGKGDSVAIKIWEEVAVHIGTALTGLINVLNPEKVVIGGGISKAGRFLFEPIRRVVQQNAFKVATDVCRIVPARLGDNAGVIGSAGYIMLE